MNFCSPLTLLNHGQHVVLGILVRDELLNAVVAILVVACVNWSLSNDWEFILRLWATLLFRFLGLSLNMLKWIYIILDFFILFRENGWAQLLFNCSIHLVYDSPVVQNELFVIFNCLSVSCGLFQSIEKLQDIKTLTDFLISFLNLLESFSKEATRKKVSHHVYLVALDV